MNKPLPEYDLVKNILIKHNVLNKDIEDLDDPILMQDLYDHFVEDMPYGTQKARTGDPDEYIYDALQDLGLPLGVHQEWEDTYLNEYTITQLIWRVGHGKNYMVTGLKEVRNSYEKRKVWRKK